jgi:hypothetical protein
MEVKRLEMNVERRFTARLFLRSEIIIKTQVCIWPEHIKYISVTWFCYFGTTYMERTAFLSTQ